ncbi:MAG: kelch repeat-containing protein [Thermoplasmata archaeon]
MRSRVNGHWLALAVVLGASFLLVAPPWAGVSHDRSITSVASATSYPTTGTSPPPTSYAAATFDAADGYVLMFGGNDVTGNPISTTWTFVHNNWTNLTSSIGPSPSARWASAMAYDPANSTVVLFGGCLNPSCSELTDDTWTYAHDRWTNLTGSLAVAPPPRGRAMMSYDAGEGRVLLFGGIGAGGVYLNDLWGFKDGRWTPISTQAAPSTRGGAMFAYDPASNSTILFGGNDGPYRFGDTWSYSNGTWTNVTPTVGPGPSPRWVGEMTYDGTDGYLLLVNGYNSGTYFGDEWTFANGKWASLSVSGGPTASYGGLLVYDPVDRYVVYFSGVASGGVLTSTLIYSGGSWTLLINPPGSNPALLFLVFFALFILVPVTFALLVGTFVQRRRERRLGEGFVLPPSEKVEWVPAGPALERQRRLRWAASLGLTLFLVLILVVPLLLTTGGSGVFLLLFELPLLLVLIAVFAFAQRGQETRAVAAARSGVILQRRRGDLRVPWGQLQPGLIRPVREMYSFQYLLPGHQAGVAGFQVTVDQARAILRSPYAPAWVLTPSVTSGLGLPVPQPWGASPPPAANPSPGGFGLPPPPLSGSSPFASSPPPQPPSVSPWTPPSTPPWTPPPPPRSPRPSVPAGPPAGTIPCPRCGQFNPIGRVVFCQSCGQRLP